MSPGEEYNISIVACTRVCGNKTNGLTVVLPEAGMMHVQCIVLHMQFHVSKAFSTEL